MTWSLGLQSRPVRCEQATVESNPVTQKLISSTESELQQSYAKQRRSKSAALLHKELNCKSKRAVRDYLFRVNEATAVLYARHVLASLLAEWPGHVPVSEDILELSGPAHMTYILDMFMQLEDRHQWEKVTRQLGWALTPLPPPLCPPPHVTSILLPVSVIFSITGTSYKYDHAVFILCVWFIPHGMMFLRCVHVVAFLFMHR